MKNNQDRIFKYDIDISFNGWGVVVEYSDGTRIPFSEYVRLISEQNQEELPEDQELSGFLEDFLIKKEAK